MTLIAWPISAYWFALYYFDYSGAGLFAAFMFTASLAECAVALRLKKNLQGRYDSLKEFLVTRIKK
jgi:hypothetical protein